MKSYKFGKYSIDIDISVPVDGLCGWFNFPNGNALGECGMRNEELGMWNEELKMWNRLKA